VSGGDKAASQLTGDIPKLSEFDKTVAVNAGIRCAAAFVLVDKIRNNLLKFFAKIHHLQRDAQMPADFLSILLSLLGTVMGNHKKTRTVIPLLQKQSRCYRTVNAAADGR
jgi:hypothetical protein